MAVCKSYQPKATIVIPLLHQVDKWLVHCVLSAVMQTAQVEVIVITSTQTPPGNLTVLETIARQHENLKSLKRHANEGFADALNKGIWAATSKRVALLLSDDWIAPNAIERCLTIDANIVMGGQRGLSADGTTTLWDRNPNMEAFCLLANLEQKANYLSHLFLFDRSALIKIGGVDRTIGLTGADDYDMPWTLLEHGATVGFVSDTLYFYRDHDNSRLTLRNQADQIADLRRILRKHGLTQSDADKLVAKKKRWYGVPVQNALDDPHWYVQDS